MGAACRAQLSPSTTPADVPPSRSMRLNIASTGTVWPSASSVSATYRWAASGVPFFAAPALAEGPSLGLVAAPLHGAPGTRAVAGRVVEHPLTVGVATDLDAVPGALGARLQDDEEQPPDEHDLTRPQGLQAGKAAVIERGVEAD